MNDTKTITACMNDLEELTLQYKGLDNILSMLFDSVENGVNSAEDYSAGIWLISMLAFEYAKRLTEIKDDLAECVKRS